MAAATILIVDDDLDTLKLVGMMLERKGYEIIAAANGRKALELVAKSLPDLILLDIMMPEMDGYEVARRLRSNPKTEFIPIIMFTAKSQIDDRIEGLEAGADAYITKPTQPRELFAQVKAMLKRTPMRSAGPQVPVAEAGMVFGVLAAKGGVGTSTLAINLAIAMRQKTKESVILSDYRPGQGTVSLDLGSGNTDGMLRLLRGEEEITKRSLEGILLTHGSGIKTLLSSPDSVDAKYVTEVDKFLEITEQLRYLASHIVLDLGAALSPLASAVVHKCDHVVLCLEPSPNNVKQTRSLFQALVKEGVGEGRITSVLINRMRISIQLSWKQTEEQFEYPIATVFTPIPEMAYQASRTNTPLVLQDSTSLTSQQFQKLASILL